jgi:hypothetical protein
VVSRVTAAVTAVKFVRNPTDWPDRPPLGQTLSGWRDLNSRPLDPQEGARLH